MALAKDRARNGMSTIVDKWVLFKQCVEGVEGAVAAELWNVRRLLYELDGATMISSLTMMVADIIGLALDRGPACCRLCKVDGVGLTMAAVNQMASFTIISYNEQGIRFDDGGDTFLVAIRFAGLGRQSVRAKIIDNAKLDSCGNRPTGLAPAASLRSHEYCPA